MHNFKRPKIGLALGSGGARGLSHIGVIKVLEKNGIPIDYIAGSSIGALVGGLYAATHDIQQVENLARTMNLRLIVALLDPSLRQSLLEGEKIKTFIDEELGGVQFKNLKIPFRAIATDIKTGEAVVLSQGSVAEAIRASISVPVVFKPVTAGQRLLADGGWSVPVPVQVVRTMGAEVVIAVNLNSYHSPLSRDKKIGIYALQRHNDDISQYNLARYSAAGAEVVLMPQTGPVKWDKFLKPNLVIAAGETATYEALSAIKKVIGTRQPPLQRFLSRLRGN